MFGTSSFSVCLRVGARASAGTAKTATVLVVVAVVMVVVVVADEVLQCR